MDLRWAIKQLVERLDGLRIYQKNIVPKEVKQRHIDGAILFIGDSADRPTDGSQDIKMWFSEDTSEFSVWNSQSEAWEGTTLS